MKTMHSVCRVALLAALSILPLQWGSAQVPHLLQHQGRIAVDGVNFNGSGQFKFALLDAGTNVAQPATATATVVAGSIVAVNVMAPGLGYTSPPAVTVNSGLGSGAVLQAVVTAGVVTSITVVNGGSGYPPIVGITIDPPPPTWVYQGYWANAADTSPTDGEPDAAVTLAVTNGLYEVLLGDTSLPNMAAIPATVFTHPDVRLRVWFDDGTHGFQLLSPDKRIAAVGYTLMAENVPDGAITQPKLAAGAVGTAQLAADAVQTANIAAGAVTQPKLAAGAVGTAQIAAGAVGTTQIASGAVGNAQLGANSVLASNIADGAVGSEEIHDGTVTAADIATAAVGSDELAPSSVIAGKIGGNAVGSAQIADNAVGTSEIAPVSIINSHLSTGAVETAHIANYAVTTIKLANGAVDSTKLGSSAVQWVHIQDGAVLTAKLAANAVTADKLAAGAVGTNQLAADAVTTAKIAAGAVTSTQMAKPPRSGSITGSSLALQFNQAPFTVNFAPSFATTPVVTLVPRTTTGEGWAPAAWLTAVSTSSFSGLLSLPVTPLTTDSTNDVGKHVSMAIVSSFPAMAYYDDTANQLMFVRATNTDGTAWGTPVLVDTTANVGQYASLAVVNGTPAIAYYDATNFNLCYVRATNTTGTAWGAPVAVDSGGDVGQYASLVVVNGNPAIAYYDATNLDLKYVRATDISGATWGAPMTLDSTGNVGHGVSMAIVSSNPAIAYGDASGSSFPKYVRAANASGTVWNSPVTVSDTGTSERIVGQIRLAVASSNPAIAFYDDTYGGLYFVRATNADGSAWPTTHTRLVAPAGATGNGLSLMVVSSNPAVSFYKNDGTLQYLRADNSTGTLWGNPVTVDGSGYVGAYTSMIMVNGRPAIAYYDAYAAEVKYLRAPDMPSSYFIGWMALEP